MKYYLPKDYKYKRINDAGSKARMDIETTMEEIGITRIWKKRTISKSRILHFLRTLAIVVRIPLTIKKGDILIIQYPIKYYSTICRITHLCKANIITIIHDLGCFRQKHNSNEQEIYLMNKSDGIICHNPTMLKWLLDNGYVGYNKKKIIKSLEIFDFLSESKSPDRRDTWPLRKIVYAGQLAIKKNKFLYDFGTHIEGFTVNVYGKGFNKANAKEPEKFEEKGFMSPNTLISNAEGDFGLVWDGDSTEYCSGNWGEYLAINTPHKVSLYIRCGLPIIIWRKAAMAEFVEKNNIGICIDSLSDINNIYRNLTEIEYHNMCNNVKRVNDIMSEGGYSSRAISEVISLI